MTNSEIIDVLNDITWNGCGRYEKEVMIECRSAVISALEENDKLKAEIERIKNESHRRSDMFLQEIEQLKADLEKSVNEKAEVISKIEYALNECEPIYNGCAFIPQAKPFYNLAMNYCLDILKGKVEK